MSDAFLSNMGDGVVVTWGIVMVLAFAAMARCGRRDCGRLGGWAVGRIVERRG